MSVYSEKSIAFKLLVSGEGEYVQFGESLRWIPTTTVIFYIKMNWHQTFDQFTWINTEMLLLFGTRSQIYM